MNARHFLPIAAAVVLSMAAVVATAEEPDDRARKIAERVTTEGAGIFDRYDARAIAATYAEPAVLTALTEEDGDLVPQVHQGRAAVEKFYAKLFEKPETIKSRNHVTHAKFLSPRVLAIDGSFEFNTLSPGGPMIPFHQVRREKDGKWEIVSMEISVLPKR